MCSVWTLPGISLDTGYTRMNSMLQPQAAAGSAGADTCADDINDTNYYVRVRHSELRKEAQTETI